MSFTNEFETEITVGYLGIGTTVEQNTPVKDIVERMLTLPKEPYPDPPNDQYESKSLGIWTKLSDVDAFFDRYTKYNGWKGLKLGNYVTFSNIEWEIAGFNMEHNQIAADRTTYDNGYGICFIPKTPHGNAAQWHEANTTAVPYRSSDICSNANSLANGLMGVVGNHLVNRNVLLGSSVNNTNGTNAYSWTTAYATAMSGYQLTGKAAKYRNKYDDGEANYKLPLFNYEQNYSTSREFWIRGWYNKNSTTLACNAYKMTTSGTITAVLTSAEISYRNMIYLR